MDDLGGLLSGVLSDPKTMEQLADMARQLGLGDISQGVETKTEPEIPGFDPELLGGIMAALRESAKPDRNTELLAALGAVLSRGRQEKLERAMRALRMAAAAKALSGHVEL